MGEADVETLKCGYAALNRGDLSVVLDLLDPDIEWHEPGWSPEAGTHRGRDSFERFFRGWLESFEQFRVEPERVVQRGDQLVAVVRQTGAGRSSGVQVETRLAHVWTVADGKAVRWEAVAEPEASWTMAASDPTDLARHALEQVCSGSDASAAVGVYSPDFHDHVNASEYRGYDGIRRSLGLYQLVFSDGDLRIRVEDQVSEGERIASRWVAEGHNRGRAIRIWGIVISRIEDGEIVEDWAASDNVDLLRQLGPWRLLLLGLAWLRSKHG